MTDEVELEHVTDELETLKRVVIDTSSIIYSQSCGILDMLGATIRLVTVPQVIEEYGEAATPCEIIDIGDGRTDDLVVACGLRIGVPVVADDRKLLLAAESAGLRFYNALIMLVLLLNRSVISPLEYSETRHRLLEVAHYSRRVQAYGDDLAQFVMTRR